VAGARAQRAARLAEAAAHRAAEHAESFDNAAPRRPMHGHTADCPNRHQGPMRRCRFCRGEALGAVRVNGVPVDRPSVLAGGARSRSYERPTQPVASAPARPLTACTAQGCWRPTDDESGLCDRCQPGGGGAS
jgi:hypothetical protein